MAEGKTMPKLDHVALEVADLDTALAFYADTLNLKLLFRKRDEEHHEAFAFLELEGGNLELLQLLNRQNRPKKKRKCEIAESCCPHVAIQTPDMSALVAQLEEKRIPIEKGPLEISGTVRWIYVRDPDNNIIEFVQWL